MPDQGQERLITTAEVARLAGVNVRTVRRWCEAGHLVPAARTPGGRRRYRRADVVALVQVAR
jgi:excisionase family DNA binding protein